MDTATAKLAVELQLEDINDLLDCLYDEEEIPDGDSRSSFLILRYDLQRQLQVLEGQILTLKILREEHDNRIAFSRLLEEERQAVTDHQLAVELAGVAIDDPDNERSDDYETSLCNASDFDEDEQWDMARELYTAAFARDMTDRVSRDEFAATGGEVKAATGSEILGTKTLAKCCACMDVVATKKTLTLECKPEPHSYCRKCLVDLFKSAIDNPTLFPPRCCKLPVPLATCRAVLPKDLIKKFDLKTEELATPNPTYCSNAECSEFIRPKDIKAEIATCVFCKDKTCVRCKCANHKGLCPKDPHVQLLMDAARRSRWQQCTKCKNMVELSSGCFHMRCRCSHEFCYLCGLKWKSCTCPQADEDYLTRPLAPIVAAAAPVSAHEHDWRPVCGLDCEECGADYLPFILRCGECDVANCWRCIHNRQ